MTQNIFKENGITFSLDAAGLLRVDGLKALPTVQADEIREHIRQHRAEIVRELVQDQFNDLWAQAWALADWIDNSSSDIPWQERAVRVPELQQMSKELDRLEKAGAKPPTKERKPV